MNGFILPYLGQIAQLKTKISQLEQSINFYKQNIQIMNQLLKANNIRYDMTLKLPANINNTTSSNVQENKKKTVAERMNSSILNEFLEICFRKSAKNHYSDEFKAFAYSLYCSSELNYRTLRSNFPFPSESCLRKRFQPQVIDFENQLSSIECVKDILIKRSKLYNIPLNQKIKATLVIDAFTTTTITPYCKQRYIDADKSNCFLFLVVPHSKNYKVFPIFLYKSKSGMSDQQTFDFINRIIDDSKASGFNLSYTSVDGDKNYQNRFITYHEKVFDAIKNLDLKTAFTIIDSLQGFQIADFLHILKNARSRLLEAIITINPAQIKDTINYYDLMNDPDINYLIKDTSTLAKLRDELPRNLFNFDTMFKIMEKHSESTLFYFFTYSLWNESIFNQKISPQTKIYFLLIALCIFFRIELYYNCVEYNSTVYEKKGVDHPFISMVTKDKLPRIVNTLLVMIKEIEESNDGTLGLNRLGSHVIENYIGRIRSLCHQDNRFETVLHNVARYELIVREFDQCFLVYKPRHTNPGGCILTQSGADFNFAYEAPLVAEWFLQKVGISEQNGENHIDAFLQSLKQFSQQNPYPKVDLPNTMNNLPIINRFYIPNVMEQEKEWEQKEIDLIDQLLLSNNEKKIYAKNTFDHSKVARKQMVQARKEILKNREWTETEDNKIIKYIKKEITLQQLRSILFLREKKLITQRKNDLIKEKNIIPPKKQNK